MLFIQREKYLAGESHFTPGTITALTGCCVSRSVPEKWRHGLIQLISYLLLMVFSGCAVQQRSSDAALSLAWEENSAKLAKIHNWHLKGRIAMQVEKESASASLSWQQNGQDYIIRIIAPFGRGTLELTGNRDGVTMRDAKNQVVHAANPEVLLQARLGWQVPLSGLYYWIRGLPEPAVEIKTMILDEQARINELSQAGWQISYGRYMQAGELSLPKKLVLQNQKLKIKLVIKRWDLSL